MGSAYNDAHISPHGIGVGTRQLRNDATYMLCDYKILIDGHSLQIDQYHLHAVLMTRGAQNHVLVPSEFDPRVNSSMAMWLLR